jgi:hypothetical protein
MTVDLELPDDVKALLRAERQYAEIPHAAQAAVTRRLAASLPTFGSAAGGAHALKKAALAGWKGLVVKGTLVIAVGGGALVLRHAAKTEPRREEPVFAAASTPAISQATDPKPVCPASAPTEQAPLPVRAPIATHVKAAPSTRIADEARLAEEQRVLDEARDALAHGDNEHALEATAEHALRFARGTLAEERYALRVRALSRLGRKEEAQSLVSEMRARFPHSFLLDGAVREAESIP